MTRVSGWTKHKLMYLVMIVRVVDPAHRLIGRQNHAGLLEIAQPNRCHDCTEYRFAADGIESGVDPEPDQAARALFQRDSEVF